MHADSIVARVRERSPQVRAIHSRSEQSVGALFLALEPAGTTVDERLLETLVESLPPVVLFGR
jgi:hypothetical protein